MTTWKFSRRMRIKRFLRRLVSIVSCYSGIAWFWNFIIARRGVRILTYHAVESPPRNSYAVSIENFQRQMSYLKEKYHVISLEEFQGYVREGKEFSPGTLLLTFDDGFKSFYKIAYPILKRLQLPSICFLIVEKVKGDDEDFLHWTEANELLKDGLTTFGSHTVSHKSLAHLNDEDLRQEVSLSREVIEEKLGVAVEIFSYPYGTRSDLDKRSVSALSAAGYKFACTSLNGLNRKRMKPLKLYRTKIEWGDDFQTFKRILRGSLDIWFLIDLCLPFLQNRGEVDFK
jgi:peptidoglycan/xylan/chitin deacetylase (PgdA/CDA1 family)